VRNHLLVARPTTITNEQILLAARLVFLEKGIRGTTAEVARRAGIAEGSIFKRFKTKEELFCAAMSEDGVPPFMALLERRAPDEDLRKTLLAVGLEMIEFFRNILPAVMMSWSNAGAIPLHLRGPNPPPVRTVRAIAEFFQQEIRAGRIAKTDPEVLARLFLGSVQNYVFFELIAREGTRALMSERVYLRRVIQVLWDGVSPWRSKEESRSSRKSRSQRSPRSERPRKPRRRVR
jgi:AcrR family transcriptional regulator